MFRPDAGGTDSQRASDFQSTPAPSGGGDADIAGLADQITEPVFVNLLTDVSLSYLRHLHRSQPGRKPVLGDE